MAVEVEVPGDALAVELPRGGLAVELPGAGDALAVALPVLPAVPSLFSRRCPVVGVGGHRKC